MLFLHNIKVFLKLLQTGRLRNLKFFLICCLLPRKYIFNSRMRDWEDFKVLYDTIFYLKDRFHRKVILQESNFLIEDVKGFQ